MAYSRYPNRCTQEEWAKIAAGNAARVSYLALGTPMIHCLASDYAPLGIRVNRVAFKALEFSASDVNLGPGVSGRSK